MLGESFEITAVEVHAADVQPQSKVIVIPEEITEALPLNHWLSVALKSGKLISMSALTPVKLSRI